MHMQDRDKLDLLKAALAVAAADKDMSRAELGIVEGLAAKAGIGQISFDAMKAAALRGEGLADNICFSSPARARQALELLVAEARIDGQITEQERSLLVTLAERLKITTEEFVTIYQAGIQRADELRARRK
jgi:uncharacterized tellurite resistance protein B-like protein